MKWRVKVEHKPWAEIQTGLTRPQDVATFAARVYWEQVGTAALPEIRVLVDRDGVVTPWTVAIEAQFVAHEGIAG